MTKDEAIQRIQKLRNEIETHSHLYYVLSKPVISDYDFDMLSISLRKKITPDNIKQNKSEIKNWFNTAAGGEKEVKIRDIIAKLDEISSRGVKIYISAGNKDNSHLNGFNLFSLVNNARVVGALDANKKKDKLSANDSLITNWETGVFKIRKFRDKNGKFGFDYTGDGTIDIYEDRTTSSKKIPRPSLFGTSFATPKVLAGENKK